MCYRDMCYRGQKCLQQDYRGHGKDNPGYRDMGTCVIRTCVIGTNKGTLLRTVGLNLIDCILNPIYQVSQVYTPLERVMM